MEPPPEPDDVDDVDDDEVEEVLCPEGPCAEGSSLPQAATSSIEEKMVAERENFIMTSLKSESFTFLQMRFIEISSCI